MAFADWIILALALAVTGVGATLLAAWAAFRAMGDEDEQP